MRWVCVFQVIEESALYGAHPKNSLFDRKINLKQQLLQTASQILSTKIKCNSKREIRFHACVSMKPW